MAGGAERFQMRTGGTRHVPMRVVVLGLVVVIVVVAAAVSLVLAHNRHRWQAMQDDLAGLDVEGLHWTGQRYDRNECSGNRDSQSGPVATRTYDVTSGSHYDETLARVDAYFASRGFRIQDPESGAKGELRFRVINPDTSPQTGQPATQVIVSVSSASC